MMWASSGVGREQKMTRRKVRVGVVFGGRLLELAGMPYVGAGVLGSAVGMDKDIQKRLLRDSGIPVVRYFSLSRADAVEERGLARRLADQLGYPVFVKPNALGSSIGITRVN